MVRLVEHWTRKGLVVSTVKHAHHTVDLDQPGKDSYRHREAGAREVMLATSRRWILTHEHRDLEEPPLESLISHMDRADLYLVEGFKRDRHPKIEVHRSERGTPLLAEDDESVIAIAADGPPQSMSRDVPCFDLNDVGGIADFAEQRLKLR